MRRRFTHQQEEEGMRKAVREGLVTRRRWRIYFEGVRLRRYRRLAARVLKEERRRAARLLEQERERPGYARLFRRR